MGYIEQKLWDLLGMTIGYVMGYVSKIMGYN